MTCDISAGLVALVELLDKARLGVAVVLQACGAPRWITDSQECAACALVELAALRSWDLANRAHLFRAGFEPKQKCARERQQQANNRDDGCLAPSAAVCVLFVESRLEGGGFRSAR